MKHQSWEPSSSWRLALHSETQIQLIEPISTKGYISFWNRFSCLIFSRHSSKPATNKRIGQQKPSIGCQRAGKKKTKMLCSNIVIKYCGLTVLLILVPYSWSTQCFECRKGKPSARTQTWFCFFKRLWRRRSDEDNSHLSCLQPCGSLWPDNPSKEVRRWIPTKFWAEGNWRRHYTRRSIWVRLWKTRRDNTESLAFVGIAPTIFHCKA